MSETEDLHPLKKIGEIELYGSDYDLAQNGGDFHLVEHKEPDAYLRPVACKVELKSWIDVAEAQALLNLLGAKYLECEALKDELDKAHGALQREAEPGRSKPKPSTRETAPVTGLLEGNQG